MVTATDTELQILISKGDTTNLSELFDYLVEFVTVYTSKNAEVKVCVTDNRLHLSMNESKRHWIQYMFYSVIREMDGMSQDQ